MDFVLSDCNLNNGHVDFNYDFDAFIQDEDIDYLAGESSGSSNTLSDGHSPPTTTELVTTMHPGPLIAPAPARTSTHSPGTLVLEQSLVSGGLRLSSPATTSAALSKQRMERRGHTKSRRGCFNCKRRRIKCQETRPSCGHCIKTGLNCEYPAAPQVIHQPQHQIPIFTLQDMRLFQHFLLQCYPHHPIGSETIWTHDIPCLSEKYEYLMHSLLAFAASELLHTDPSLIEPAMSHRLKAIKSIKKTLTDVSVSKTKDTMEEGNALMATCFALTFQSVFLEDGMGEYMTFIRGVIIVAYQMYVKGSRFLFGEFMGERQVEVLEGFMVEVKVIERGWVDGAVGGIRGLEGLLNDTEVDRTTERRYYELILDMAEKCYTSSWEAYKALTAHYAWWMMLPHDQFERLIDPGNQVAILLASHWIALKQVMARITETEKLGFGKVPPERREEGRHDMDVGIVRWLKFLNRSVGEGFRGYNEWPEWVEERLDEDLGYFGKGSVKCPRIGG